LALEFHFINSNYVIGFNIIRWFFRRKIHCWKITRTFKPPSSVKVSLYMHGLDWPGLMFLCSS